ncbi:endonuclease/exonuclease/phosphatase family protein [Salegentibacter chungangensis]|uniref:Endonuclease/exonuclease/phosphatase family protein n=1 Tax=Salegentibacter chungangensis TaxID=1335724 RepID=A0ABW3NR63_9FLAO
MKKLNLFDKFVFILNSLAAVALLLSYLLPFVPPKTFPLLSVLSLGVPVLIILNAVFGLYWLIKLKRQVLLSVLVLLLGFNYVTSLYKFSDARESLGAADELSVMSYNVRMFNAYEWSDDKAIPSKITALIKEKQPDVLCVQEYYVSATQLAEYYPYSYIKLKDEGSEFGSAIFSKFPIVEKYSVNFPHDGNNNAIYADIVREKDTIRVFNVHFQSLNIKPQIDELQKEDSKKLLGRIGQGFGMQQEQAKMMMEEVNASPYRTLVIGDFNNTAFSYIFDQVTEGDQFNDAFLEAGTGFGQTFNLNYFPLRIDFLLIDKKIDVNSYKRFKVDYSDHYPIMAKLGL